MINGVELCAVGFIPGEAVFPRHRRIDPHVRAFGISTVHLFHNRIYYLLHFVCLTSTQCHVVVSIAIGLSPDTP